MNYIHILLSLVPTFHVNDKVTVLLPSYNLCTGIVYSVNDTSKGYLYNVYIQECPDYKVEHSMIKYVEEQFIDYTP